VETDGLTHVYTLLLHPANSSYDILVDGVSKKAGTLADDFEPAFNPPAEIDDPKDSKPSDWVDVARIPDPAAKKPADWDEDAPRMIDDADAVKPDGWLDDEPSEVDDPDAKQPADWDEEEDGTWEAPKVPNPACAAAPGCGPWTRPKKINPDFKGKWTAPMVDNPAYKGPWAPRKIPNPDFYEDATPLASIGKVGGIALEIWTMDKGQSFGNVLLSTDPADAAAAREEHWAPKHAVEAEEAAKKEAEAKLKAEADAKKAAAAGGSLADRLLALFEEGAPLAGLRDVAEPLLDAVADNEWLAWVVVALPALLAAAPVALLAKGRAGTPAKKAPSAAATAAAAKKAGKAPATASKKKDDGDASDAAGSEGEADDDKAAPRRRSRRDQ
jgi:calnexin